MAHHGDAGQRLANPDRFRDPQRSAERDDPAHHGHVGLEAGIDETQVGFGVVGVVDAGRSVAVALLHDQALVHGLGDERQDRCHELAERDENLVEGGEGCQGVPLRGGASLVALPPEPTPGAADVPVGEIVHEIDERWNHRIEVVALHLIVDLLDEALQHRQDPPIDLGAVGRRRGLGEVGGRQAVGGGVGGEERVGVPKRQQDGADHFPDTRL